MPRAAVCQPEPISRPAKVVSAAASSRWNGWKSKSFAKPTMSSRVTVSGSPTITSPTEKSSRAGSGMAGSSR